LGGGAFTQPENAELRQRAGPTIFLDAPVAELFRRCQQEAVERPLAGNFDQFCKLYEERRPVYMAGAMRIETNGKDVRTVASEIASKLGLPPRSGGPEGVVT